MAERMWHEADAVRCHLRHQHEGLHLPVGNDCRPVCTAVVDQVDTDEVLLQIFLNPAAIALHKDESGDGGLLQLPDVTLLLPIDNGFMDERVELLLQPRMDSFHLCTVNEQVTPRGGGGALHIGLFSLFRA